MSLTSAERHAVVTGGTSGIGLAIANALALAGHPVTVLGRNADRVRAAEAQLGDKGRGAVCDVTDERAVVRAFAEATATLGPVQILVNNAGAAESAPLARTSLALWRRMIDVNVTSAFLCQQQVLPGMRAAGVGRLVNIASTAALKGYPYVTAYVAAKHALLGLTRATAVEVASTGITVNAVCPGYVDTPLLDRSVETIVAATGRTPEAVRATFTASNPQGRLIQPGEVAAAVLWLVSEGAASVTGQAIVLSGGEIG